ncbi:hypothetical protein ACJMK2_023024 [Sinanodonta woodiana]|uniref:Uncharacterized protein n=1 Tax=Sinanodonta woodiana TaxID=1069815 RepID=A0ABD3T3U8_SINWO
MADKQWNPILLIQHNQARSIAITLRQLLDTIKHVPSDANIAEDKRPKYMETRDLSAFKDLVLYAMEKLAAEGRINPELLVSSSESAPEGAVERRGRHLGLCVRRRGSTLTPYPCWKAG